MTADDARAKVRAVYPGAAVSSCSVDDPTIYCIKWPFRAVLSHWFTSIDLAWLDAAARLEGETR